MNIATALTLAAMYLIPLAGLVWLYSKEPAYAFLGVVILGVLFGVGGEF